MPNYFKIKDYGIVEVKGITIIGDGREGVGNAAEQFCGDRLNIPIENIEEITREEYEKLS